MPDKPFIKYVGHACVQLEVVGSTILIDPYISENPLIDVPVSSFEPDLILVTHAHHDHLGDTVEIAESCGAPVIALNELSIWLGRRGVAVEALHYGGEFIMDEIRIRALPAWHSSALTDGSSDPVHMGAACGFIIQSQDFCIYHAGDTCLFGDMSLIGARYGPIDLACLPVGGRFTMDPADAAYAAELLDAGAVLPMHYDTFPAIHRSADEILNAFSSRGKRLIHLRPGEGSSL